MTYMNRLTMVMIAILALIPGEASAYDGVCRTAGDIDALQPGQWCVTSTNTISDAKPVPTPPGGISVSGVMAWSSGAYDTRRDRLLVWGGGDGDYSGNEIYAFDLATMRWSRVWGPTDVSLIPVGSGTSWEVYPDGNPGSRHTYDGIEYLPDRDVLWASGGSLWATGWGGHYTWFFDFASQSWQRKADKVSGALDATCAYDPLSHHVFMNSYSQFYEYDPASDVWTVRGGFGAGFSGSNNAEIDPVHRRYIIVGASGSLPAGSVGYFDLSGSGNNLQLQLQPTSGNSEITRAFYPGFAYDSANNQFVAWDGESGNTQNVYVLNTTTWRWTKVPPAPTNLVTPTTRFSTGTFGRFRYIPSKNAFMVVNHATQQVYFYKLSTGSPAPVDSVAPSAPGDLRPR